MQVQQCPGMCVHIRDLQSNLGTVTWPPSRQTISRSPLPPLSLQLHPQRAQRATKTQITVLGHCTVHPKGSQCPG